MTASRVVSSIKLHRKGFRNNVIKTPKPETL